jgi:hypothetical protein
MRFGCSRGRDDRDVDGDVGASAMRAKALFDLRRRFALLLTVVCIAPQARALDRFEIQVYDEAKNEPGVTSLENHVNFTPKGSKVPDGPMLPTDDQFHWTLEGALGLTRIWEAGVYVQTALLGDGTPEFAGAKVRSKLIFPPFWEGRAWVGVNVEVSAIPRRFEAEVWGTEVRPIAALELPWLRAALNPILSLPLTSAASDGPHFEPAASIKGVLPFGRSALGVEYYGDVGPLISPSPPREQQHYLYGALDASIGTGIELNFGVGGRIAGAADALVIKGILGFELGRLWQPMD